MQQPIQNIQSPELSQMGAENAGVDMDKTLAIAEQELDQELLASLETADHNIQVETEKLPGRQRRISASITLPHSLEQIWQILTDYDQLADFIPSLDQSQRIESSPETPSNQVRIEQVGAECLLSIKFCARVVLDMVEQFPHRIDFEMVQGDFRSFMGYWELQPIADPADTGLVLKYSLDVLPARWMPVGLIERHLKKNLITNLLAIQQRAAELF